MYRNYTYKLFGKLFNKVYIFLPIWDKRLKTKMTLKIYNMLSKKKKILFLLKKGVFSQKNQRFYLMWFKPFTIFRAPSSVYHFVDYTPAAYFYMIYRTNEPLDFFIDRFIMFTVLFKNHVSLLLSIFKTFHTLKNQSFWFGRIKKVFKLSRDGYLFFIVFSALSH